MFPRISRHLLKFIRIQRCACRRLSTQQELRKQPGTRSIFDSGNLLLICPITCLCLAYWQVKRKKWKEELIAAIEDRCEMEPLELPADLDEIKKLELYPVKVRGHFDYTNEVYIGPRTGSREIDRVNDVPGNKGKGVHVITPFKLSDRDLTILVNRGWIEDTDLASEEARKLGQVHGQQEIVGFLRQNQDTQARFWKFLMDYDRPEDKFGCDVYFVRKIDVLAERCGTAPIFIDSKTKRKSPNEPKPVPLGTELRNQHIAYIVTWTSLAILTTYLWLVKYRYPARISTLDTYIKRQEASRNSRN